jgi:Immunity protein 26
MKTNFCDNSKNILFKLGDVFEIPLPNQKFAYGRVYDDAGVGVYKEISDLPDNPPIGSREFMFNVGMYADILKSGEWRIIANDPFINEDSFPPPSFIKDIISGGFSVYEKGVIRESTEEECKELEECAVWDSHHIIERIMGIMNDKR